MMMMMMMMMNAFFRVFLVVIALYYYIPRHVLMTGRIASELASFFSMAIGIGSMYEGTSHNGGA